MNGPQHQQMVERLVAASSVVFRGATVVTVDPQLGVINDGDVLVVGERIAAVGHALEAPEGSVEVDASGGILMPGMIDTHRHMWQTAQRGLGADWTLTNYFYYYYLDWGQIFRPQDVYAGNLLAALESVDAGVTTTVDWSHGLRTTEHAEAAVDALEAVPGRFVLAYGNIAAAPWEWATSPDFRSFAERRFPSGNDMLSLQLAFDITGGEEFPEKAAFEIARKLDLRVTTHTGARGATTDDAVRLTAEHGFLTDKLVHVHASTLSQDSYQRIAASGGYASVSAESESNAGQGYPSTFALRKYGIPVSLSVDTSAWWSGDMFSAMRATLNSDRARTHLEAHGRNETNVNNDLRADQVVEYATQGGANAAGLGDVTGSITVGKKADLVLVKNDASPVMFPILNPAGHLVFQAGRGDVHTVVVNGRVLKYGHQLLLADRLDEAKRVIAESTAHVREQMGPEAWERVMHPDQPDTQQIDNPYQYIDGATKPSV